MSLEHLVSAVGKEPHLLAKQMGIGTDAVIINQKVPYGYEEFTESGSRIRVFSMDEQGVGLSRNTALERAEGELVLFGDEDIVYVPEYAKIVEAAFRAHPDADVLLFNVKVTEDRRTYWTGKTRRIHRWNCGRYPAYSIAARTKSLHAAGITWHLWFGGGAKYSNGEDSIFLNDCLKKGLKIYALPDVIGEEIPRPSTWFHGYNEKFFYDRGVLYHYLYGCLAPVMAFRWLNKGRKTMFGEIPYARAKQIMRDGYHLKNEQ